MRKIAFFVSILIIAAALTGCVKPNKSGDYSNFVKREGTVAGQTLESPTGLSIYGVYPSEVSTEGKEKIRIYGAGFERETKIFLQQPEMTLEAYVFNPGTLEAWMPPHYAGYFIIGVINPDGEIARWGKLFKYVERE